MADIPEFVAPDFLSGQSVDEVHARMMSSLPDTLDKGEGGFPWDFTRPAANEKAELVGFILMKAIMSIFPQWSDGIMLDYHAPGRGMTRRAAEYARTSVTITGAAGTVIPKAFGVSTPGSYTSTGVGFRTDSEVVIPESGTVTVGVTAVNAGSEGNVAAGTITLMDEPITGITGITNPTAATGGLDEESDDALRERIMDYDADQGVSYVGSESDYKRWAMAVPGVGSVQVQGSENGDGVVKLILTDSEGNPAGEALRTAVYNHIMRPDNPQARLAEVNAQLRVIAPTTVTITVAAKITTDGTATTEDVAAELNTKLGAYYKSGETEDGVIRLTAVGALLRSCAGVKDYEDLTLNGAAANVTIAAGEIAVTGAGDITMTEAST